jgi:hypothetical protein
MKPDAAVDDNSQSGPAAQSLIEFEILFEEPSELPPQRQFDHSIPLLPGAKPVNLRP